MANPLRVCRGHLLTPAALAAALSLVPGARGTQAQGIPPWTFAVHAGRSEIHGSDEGGSIALIGVNRFLEHSGRLRLGGELGLSVGGDAGFVLARAVAELHSLPTGVVSPFITGSIGQLGEAEYWGSVFSVGGGLVVNPSRALGLRAGVSRGTHAGYSGPHAILFGVDYHFGKKTAPALSASSAAPEYYLSLGNSFAARSDPGPPGGPVRPDISYPAQLYELLRAGRPQLEHVNLACGGETAWGMIGGGACNPRLDGHVRYAQGTQLAEAVAFLHAHRQHIAFVTIDIGGNDAVWCIERARGADCMARMLENVRRIAAELRAAAGPATPIVGMNYYSPFLASWLTGEAGRRTAAQLTDSVVVPLNERVAAAYASAGILLADVAAAFSTADYTLVPAPQLGEVPRNVQHICQWTSMCTAGDLHPNAEGYGVIAKAFAAVLK